MKKLKVRLTQVFQATILYIATSQISLGMEEQDTNASFQIIAPLQLASDQTDTPLHPAAIPDGMNDHFSNLPGELVGVIDSFLDHNADYAAMKRMSLFIYRNIKKREFFSLKFEDLESSLNFIEDVKNRLNQNIRANKVSFNNLQRRILSEDNTKNNMKGILDHELQDFIPIFKRMPNLISLNVSYCAHLTGAGFAPLINLTSLNLSGCDNLTDIILLQIIKRNPKLRSLNVSYCTHLTGAGFAPLINLTSLDLSGCESLTADILLQIIARNPKLTSLDLVWCNQLTDGILLQIIERNPKLTSLNLGFCKQMTDAGFSSRANLTSLDLSACDNLTDGILLQIIERNPKLTSLNVSYCDHLTGAGFAPLINLTSLCLPCRNNLTDGILLQIIERNPKLTSLYLFFCNQLTGAGFSSLAQLIHLKELCLVDCNNITDGVLLQIIDHSPKLRSLDLFWCAITDAVLAELKQKNVKLQIFR